MKKGLYFLCVWGDNPFVANMEAEMDMIEKIVESIIQAIPSSDINEQSCINFAIENGYQKIHGQKAWVNIFRELKSL